MQTVYRVYEGTREPHRLAVERAAEVLGRGGLALIPSMAPRSLRSVPATAVSSLSSNVNSRKPSLGWSMVSRRSTAMAWISRKMPAYLRDDAGREP